MAALFLAAFGLGVAFSAPPGVVTALAGAAYLTQNPFVRVAMETGGAILLWWLAWQAVRNAAGTPRPRAAPPAIAGGFATGAVISLSNPFAVAFWLGVGGSMVSGADAHPRPAHYVAFFSGFMSAAVLWCFVLSALVTWGRQFVTPRFFRWVSLGCGAALGYFGSRLLWTALTSVSVLP